MKNSRIIIFFIGLVLIFNFTIGVVTVRAADDDEEEDDDALQERERTEAKKDTYVEMYDPTANNGGKDWLIVGKWLKPTEAYLYFEFEDEPDNWKEVEISLDIYYVSETMNVEIYLIKASWDELTLNWINKPNKSKLIDSFTVAETDIYKFEVTDEVEDLLEDDKERISICISTNITSNGHFQATSREGYSQKDDAPLLIWRYEIVIDVDYYIPIIVIGGIVGVIIIIVLVVDNRKKKSRETKEPATAIPVTEYQVENVVRSVETSQNGYCTNCGKARELNASYCDYCGLELENR